MNLGVHACMRAYAGICGHTSATSCAFFFFSSPSSFCSSAIIALSPLTCGSSWVSFLQSRGGLVGHRGRNDLRRGHARNGRRERERVPVLHKLRLGRLGLVRRLDRRVHIHRLMEGSEKMA